MNHNENEAALYISGACQGFFFIEFTENEEMEGTNSNEILQQMILYI